IVSRKKVVDKRALGGISAVILAEALSSSETVRAQAAGIDISSADDPTLINLLASTEMNLERRSILKTRPARILLHVHSRFHGTCLRSLVGLRWRAMDMGRTNF